MKTRIAVLLSLNVLGIRPDLHDVESLQALLRMDARCDTIKESRVKRVKLMCS